MIKQDRGIFDAFPLSLVTTQTIDRLGKTLSTHLDVQRFRPNILVETAVETPFLEDSWVGSVLRIGTMRMRVDKRDGRCVVITIEGTNITAAVTPIANISTKRAGGATKPTLAVPIP